jgi:hypothetical protein
LRNRSGEDYTGLIIPPVRFLSSQALEKISQFARSGGKVLFLGGAPETIVEKTYKDGMASSGHAFFRDPPSSVRIANQLDDGALTHLPASDVSLAPATTDVKYLRRSLEDGEVYFFFNEGGRKIETTATLDGSGVAELWDARTGERTTLPSKRAGEKVSAPLWLEPYATAVIAVRSGAGSAPVQHPERLRNVLAIGGDWSIQLDEKSVSGPLRSWADLGMPGYWGTGIYRKKFDYSGNASGRRLWLDLGEVRYAARVRLNGQDLGSRAWGPFRFDASRAIRAGQNALEVEVASTRANELAGDASRLKSIEDKGWLKNSYVKMYLKFDQEMVPAGLLGPVVLAISEPAQ